MNAEDRTQALRLLKDFEDLFDVTLGYWDTDNFNLELNIDSKPFNYKFFRCLELTSRPLSKSYTA